MSFCACRKSQARCVCTSPCDPASDLEHDFAFFGPQGIQSRYAAGLNGAPPSVSTAPMQQQQQPSFTPSTRASYDQVTLNRIHQQVIACLVRVASHESACFTTGHRSLWLRVDELIELAFAGNGNILSWCTCPHSRNGRFITYVVSAKCGTTAVLTGQ